MSESCVRPGVPHGQTESGGSTVTRLAVTCVRPEAVLPDRKLYLPTFSHFLIVNNLPFGANPRKD
jgi:hypothetical protein